MMCLKCVFTTMHDWDDNGDVGRITAITPSITTHLPGNSVLRASHIFLSLHLFMYYSAHLLNEFSCISPRTLPVIQYVICISYTKITHSQQPMGATGCHLGNLRPGTSFPPLYFRLSFRTSNANSIPRKYNALWSEMRLAKKYR